MHNLYPGQAQSLGLCITLGCSPQSEVSRIETQLHAVQDAFLEQTREYYAAEGARLMLELDVADYLLHCEVRCDLAYWNAEFGMWPLKSCGSTVSVGPRMRIAGTRDRALELLSENVQRRLAEMYYLSKSARLPR